MTSTTLSSAISEAEFQKQVTDLAEIFHWSWAHFRPARTLKGWRTPVSGPLGEGFPDLVLIQALGPRRRLIFAELKSEEGRVTVEQAEIMQMFREAGAEGYIWRPSDFDQIAEILR